MIYYAPILEILDELNFIQWKTVAFEVYGSV